MSERGTIAAGASSISMSRAGSEPQKFYVDRPFVFVIHDACNNMILFQGRYLGKSSA